LLLEIEATKRRIEELDREIDLHVYELYDLTEEEIRIVEAEMSHRRDAKDAEAERN